MKASGEQIVENVVAVNASGAIVPNPIDLGEESDIPILQLYGTGLRNRTDLSHVTVTIGGVNAVVHYAGAQNQFPGLDQLNVEIPKTLRGRGLVPVSVTVEGEEANTLRIQLR